MNKKYRLLAILLSVLLVFSGMVGFLPRESVLAEGYPEPDLFFSEYIEGSGENKALEIYNPTNEVITLAGNYSVQIFSNGSTSANSTIGLSGTINPNGVFVIANSHSGVSTDISKVADQTHESINFNGNDAIVLKRGDTVLDRIGKVGEDPGSGGWGSDLTTTKDHTLVRKSTVWRGNNNEKTDFNPSEEWIGHPVDTFSHLGSHTMDDIHYVSFSAGEGGFTDGTPSFEWVVDGQAAHPPGASNILPPVGKIFDKWDKDYTNITASLDLIALYKDIPPDLFFSEYVEPASGNDKALEIYNPTERSINLSTYKIKLFMNGNTSAQYTLSLTGTLDSGQVYVIAHTSFDFGDKVVPHLKWGSLGFNGNDAIVLYKVMDDKDIAIDRIGKVGENPDTASTPGTGWSNGGVQTADRTLIRKPSTINGDPNYGSDFDPSLEWYVYWVNSSANGLDHTLGTHDTNQYTVNFDSGMYGSITSGQSSQTLYRGQSAVAPDVTPQKGYEFLGWEGDFLRVTNNMTILANYRPEPILFFSEYLEGSENNKALEIFNYSDHEVDLTNYEVTLYRDGASQAPLAFALEGSLGPKSVYVIANTNADQAIYGKANKKFNTLDFNGNDALVLQKRDGYILDCIGEIGFDPGTAWTSNEVSTKDMTLIRKPHVQEGYTDCDQPFYPSDQWIAVGKDNFDFIGNLNLPKYSITFKAGAHGSIIPGGLDESIQDNIEYGQDAVAPEINADYGYLHTGWNGSYTNVTSNVVLTAQYDKKTYGVTFEIDPAKGRLVSDNPSQTIPYEGAALSPQVEPLDDYIFIGWDTDLRKVTKDLSVKALYQSWAPLDLFFSEYIEGESNNKALEIYNPTSQDIDLAVGGYKVCMYFNYGDGGEAAYTHTLEIPLTGTIKAHKTYVLKHSEANLISYPEDQINGAGWFNGNDRVVLMRETDIIDEIGKFGENPDPNEKDNEVIVGWKMRDVQTGNRTLVRKPWVCRGVIHDDLPFFDPSAQWTVYKVNTFDNLGSHHCSVVHLVTFDPNEGEVKSGDLIQSVYSGENATAPTLKAPEGYTFAGWDKLFAVVQSDLVVTAQWTANQYTVSFNSRGGSAVSAIPATYDEPYGNLPEPTRTGYNFEGWFDAEESSNEITSDTILKTASNHTLYAQWGINSYTLSFDSKEGSEIPPITQDYGTLICGPDDPVRTGYTFMGWMPDLPATMPAKNMTLEAQWELNTYTITFETGGGSKIAPMAVDYGATIVPPASPVWYCCSFKGWRPALPATMPAEDLTVKALWEVNAYTIIFDSAGGSFIPPLSQDFGSPISPPKDPVRTGYTFLGWEPALPDTMPMEGMELVAQWQINQYRLIFDSDGGSPLAPQVLDYGSEIKAPVNPLRLGYRFMGWEPALPDRMGAADMTVKALWQRVGVVEGEDDETPGQGTPGTGDKPGSGQGSDLDRVPSTGESLPMTESLAFLGLAFLLLLAWRRRLLGLKERREEQV